MRTPFQIMLSFKASGLNSIQSWTLEAGGVSLSLVRADDTEVLSDPVYTYSARPLFAYIFTIGKR